MDAETMMPENTIVPEGFLKFQKVFTTTPKRYVKRGSHTSTNRLIGFWKALYDKHLYNVSYETLEYEAILFFGTNETRVLEKYIGRPKKLIRYPGSNIVRINTTNGKVAKFLYMNERTEQQKKGLAEKLGLLTWEDKRCILHHEHQEYFTVQTVLNPFQKNERLESKDNLFVSPIVQGFHNNVSERPMARSMMDAPSKDTLDKETGEREREVIDSAHKLSLNHYACKHIEAYPKPSLPQRSRSNTGVTSTRSNEQERGSNG